MNTFTVTLLELDQKDGRKKPNHFSKFSQLRPRYCVLAGAIKTYNVCVCVCLTRKRQYHA